MVTHSSTLAWKIPWMEEEPGKLQSMGSLRVRHDWATLLSLFTFMHWRRKWQPTPMFLPGESQRWGSLMGCHIWGRTELDTTEVTQQHVWMWELDHKEGWTVKNWCFWIVVLKKIIEGPLYSMEIKPVNPKGKQPWGFIGRTDAEAAILWLPDEKNWLTGKDSDAGKERGQEEMASATQWTWVWASSRS